MILQTLLLLFGIFWVIIAVIGNIFCYCEADKDKWNPIDDKGIAVALKWAYFWPFLLMYWVPRILWTQFRPWLSGEIRKFIKHNLTAIRVWRGKQNA